MSLQEHLKSGSLKTATCKKHSMKGLGLKKNEKLEIAILLIISCTHRIKRPVDIVTLAKNILYAKKCMGNLEAVANAVSLSTQQLKDFLAVERLSSEVKALVKKRAIDSVDVIKVLTQLPAQKQRVLAKRFANGQLTSKDIRIITTFAQKFPHKSISKIVANYEKSKDFRVYVIEFRVPTSFKNSSRLYKRFIGIVGKDGIKDLSLREDIGVLELTVLGHKKLRDAVRERKTTLRKFVPSVVEEITRQK